MTSTEVTRIGSARARHLVGAPALAETALAPHQRCERSTAELRLTLSTAFLLSGRPLEAVEEAEAVLAETDLSDELYAAAEGERLLALLADDDLTATRAAAESILAGGARAAGDAALAGAFTALGLIAWDDGRVTDALGLLRAAVSRSDRGSLDSRLNPRLALAPMLIAGGELDEASELIASAARQIETADDSLWADVPSIYRARVHLAAGRLEDAAADAEAGVVTANERGTTFFAPFAMATLATVALRRGDLDEAARQVARYRAAPPPPRVGFGSSTYAWTEARLTNARHGAVAAVEALTDLYTDDAAQRRLLVEEPAAAGWLVRTALAAGCRMRAEDVARGAEQLAAGNPLVGAIAASALHARGLLDRDPVALEQAARTHRSHWARGTAFEDAAVALADAGQREGSRGQLHEAKTAYALAGATRDVARVETREGELGRRRSSHIARPAQGWDSLTDAERRVAHVVAEGLTNSEVGSRLYLSRYTIDFHLRQIFRKLGLRSRVELTRLVLTGTCPTS
jgi:DNA-binding CsgD family transcriptional regulator/tetratricopeptide (TPR) repeat protein